MAKKRPAKKATKSKSQPGLKTIDETVINILISQLNVDLIENGGYQRGITGRVAAIVAKGISKEGFGYLTVGKRIDGTYWVVDGQQRMEATRILGGIYVPCYVFNSRGREHEAQVFDIMNCDRTKLKPVVEYLSKLVAGDPLVLQINEIIQDGGFFVPMPSAVSGKKWPAITCPVMLINAAKKTEKNFGNIDGLTVLRWVVKTISKIWYEQTEATNESFIGGLERFYRLYHNDPNFNEKRLIKALTKPNAKTALQIKYKVHEMQAKAKAGGHQSARHKWLTVYMWDMHNKGLPSSKRLPPPFLLELLADDDD